MADKKGFYFRLALANVKRSREVYIPYFIAGGLISGTFFLILTMIFGKGLDNVPSGDTTRMMFTFGVVVFALFAFLFILYINRFLVTRRKREFGLYTVLGLSRRHVSRVLMWENLMVMTAAVVAGMAMGALLGRLLFMIMIRVMGFAAGTAGSFNVPLVAVWGTLAAFGITLLVTTVYNSIRIYTASTAQLLKGDNEGEKPPRSVLPGTIIGLILLIAAYAAASITSQMENFSLAVLMFFPAVAAVIVATFLLFSSGSIAFLRVLRNNKRIYYKLNNFVAISGMFHRMRQNARGLASICILSTMLLVTLAGTVTLYIGRENIIRHSSPTDMLFIFLDEDDKATEITPFLAEADSIAAKYNVTVVSPIDKVRVVDPSKLTWDMGRTDTDVASMDEVTQYDNAILIRSSLMLDLDGTMENRAAAAEAISDYFHSTGIEAYSNTYFDVRETNNATTGGVLFLGMFFAVLFLAVTVLIIYFKQITEGFEDKEQYDILQKVGMNQEQVKTTINKQIIWVFLLPLAGAILHTLAASGMISKMLAMFQLYDFSLTIKCALVISALYAAVYLIVYRQTARVYYRIVKR